MSGPQLQSYRRQPPPSLSCSRKVRQLKFLVLPPYTVCGGPYGQDLCCQAPQCLPAPSQLSFSQQSSLFGTGRQPTAFKPLPSATAVPILQNTKCGRQRSFPGVSPIPDGLLAKACGLGQHAASPAASRASSMQQTARRCPQSGSCCHQAPP